VILPGRTRQQVKLRQSGVREWHFLALGGSFAKGLPPRLSCRPAARYRAVWRSIEQTLLTHKSWVCRALCRLMPHAVPSSPARKSALFVCPSDPGTARRVCHRPPPRVLEFRRTTTCGRRNGAPRWLRVAGDSRDLPVRSHAMASQAKVTRRAPIFGSGASLTNFAWS
jgi:hypothetical protein